MLFSIIFSTFPLWRHHLFDFCTFGVGWCSLIQNELLLLWDLVQQRLVLVFAGICRVLITWWRPTWSTTPWCQPDVIIWLVAELIRNWTSQTLQILYLTPLNLMFVRPAVRPSGKISFEHLSSVLLPVSGDQCPVLTALYPPDQDQSPVCFLTSCLVWICIFCRPTQ